ncbi:MAG: NERD domain-containing protein [bacterium]
MPLHYSPNRSTNTFEEAVVRELSQLDCEPDVDGFIAHNVLLPHIKDRYLPNEHDVILLLPHAGYTVDAKEYMPGEYRIPPNGPIEFRAPGKEFRALKQLPQPYQVADKKAKVLSEACRKVDPLFSSYQIQSLIVVPNHATLVGMGDDHKHLDIRLRIVRLSDLRQVILNDMRGSRLGQTLEAHELELIFTAIGALPSSSEDVVEVCDLRLLESMDCNEPGCLVPMHAYRGEHMVAGVQTEIRVYRRWPWTPVTDRFMKRMGKRVKLLYNTCLENVTRVIQTADLPDAFILATNWFDGETVVELVRRRGSLSASLAAGLILHLARTVQLLHARNIIHLDIRPEHVRIAPHLEDHGGARHLLAGFTNPLLDDTQLSTQTYATGFDASFSAPEMQYPRHPDRGKPQNDVYSIGRLLAYCVLGEEQYRRGLRDNGELVLPEDVTGHVQECIRMSTELRFGTRIASVKELAKYLGNDK